MARVLHLSTVHPASDPRILEKQAAAMAASGHDVTVLARFAAGAVARGRELGLKVETLSQRSSRRSRLVDQLGLKARIAQHDPDLIFVHDPELLPFANWLKHRGYAVVYDAHEDLPLQLLSKPWLPSWSRMPAAMATLLVQKPLMAGLDGLMAATQPVASSLGCPATVVRNFPDLSRFPAPVPDGERKASLAYVGAISEIRGLREMMNLLQELPNYRLVLVGRWESESLRQWAEAHPAWNRVESTGPLAHQDAIQAIADARLGLCLLHSRPNYLEALPTKLFEYMALGIPVLASNFPLWREIVADAQCGQVADPIKRSDVFEAAQDVLSSQGLGANGHRAVHRHYSWQSESKRLMGFMDRILQHRSAADR